MRYRCVAALAPVQQCRTAAGALSVHHLLATPAIIFNRKDSLRDAFLAQRCKLQGS